MFAQFINVFYYFIQYLSSTVPIKSGKISDKLKNRQIELVTVC